jgi:hypothetical protein
MTRPDERAANSAMNDYAAELSERMPLDEERAEFPSNALTWACVLFVAALMFGLVVFPVLETIVRAWAASRGML